MTEYTGQLIGGPDNGNLITATTETVPVTYTFTYWPDGKEKPSVTVTIDGTYVWFRSLGYFHWEHGTTTHDVSVK